MNRSPAAPRSRRALRGLLLALPLLASVPLVASSCTGPGGDPAPERITSTSAALVTLAPMIQGRSGHSATLLPDGTILLAGGRADDQDKGRTAEIYNPITGRSTPTAQPMTASRSGHTATLLPNGWVLLVGGADAAGMGVAEASGSAELYDPGTATFRAHPFPLHAPRVNHTATLLRDGRVLLAGGTSGDSVIVALDETGPIDPGSKGLAWAEVFDPKSERFSPTQGGMARPRSRHTASLLADGRVLFVGGDDDPEGRFVAGETAEIYDPVSDTFTPTVGAPHRAFSHHIAVLLPSGRVLFAGGFSRPFPDGGRDLSVELRQAEIYDVGSDRFVVTGALSTFRQNPSATLLPSGRVLLVGGEDEAGGTLEIFDPEAGSFLPPEALPATRNGGHTATLLPSGAVLIAGGSTLVAGALAPSSDTLGYDPSEGGFQPPAATKVSRVLHTASLLLTGDVLFAGGAVGGENAFFPAAEVYSPGDGAIRPTEGHMHNLRAGHAATVLGTGEVLFTGGSDQALGPEGDAQGTLATAELYQPATDGFTVVPSMAFARANHTATLLPSDEVLIAGGSSSELPDIRTAELYDPLPGLFFPITAPMVSPRSAHVAALLRSGDVLLAGGYWGPDVLRTAELYDPRAHTFRPTGSMASAHATTMLGGFSATLLPSGKVLIVGHDGAELFDPEAQNGAGAFLPSAASADDASHRNGHTATLLPSGKVLIAGGTDATGTPLFSSALYDPATDRFLAPSPMSIDRAFHTATLIPSGQVLIAGGFSTMGIVGSHERWDDGHSAGARVPRITGIEGSLAGESVILRGDRFLGTLETGGGATNTSSTNLPVALWLPFAGGMSTGVLRDIHDSSAEWAFPAARITGPGLLFLGVSGHHDRGVPLSLGQDRACSSSADCPEGQACSSEGTCGPPVVSGPPAEGCSCLAAGAPAPPSGALASVGLIGLIALVARARPPRRLATSSRRSRARRARGRGTHTRPRSRRSPR